MRRKCDPGRTFQYLKESYRKERDRLFSRVCGDRTGGNRHKEKVFCSEALEQVAQRCGGCPIPGDFQGEAGSSPGQHDLAVVSLFIAGGLDLDGLQWSLPILRSL